MKSSIKYIIDVFERMTSSTPEDPVKTQQRVTVTSPTTIPPTSSASTSSTVNRSGAVALIAKKYTSPSSESDDSIPKTSTSPTGSSHLFKEHPFTKLKQINKELEDRLSTSLNEQEQLQKELNSTRYKLEENEQNTRQLESTNKMLQTEIDRLSQELLKTKHNMEYGQQGQSSITKEFQQKEEQWKLMESSYIHQLQHLQQVIESNEKEFITTLETKANERLVAQEKLNELHNQLEELRQVAQTRADTLLQANNLQQIQDSQIDEYKNKVQVLESQLRTLEETKDKQLQETQEKVLAVELSNVQFQIRCKELQEDIDEMLKEHLEVTAQLAETHEIISQFHSIIETLEKREQQQNTQPSSTVELG